MIKDADILKHNFARIQPFCPSFGKCCGCSFQDISYKDELKLKEDYLRELLRQKNLLGSDNALAPIVASPEEYHYRNRIDLKLKRVMNGSIFVGFTPIDRQGVVPVDECFIAKKEISAAIPRIKEEAINKSWIHPRFRLANLTVRTGDDGRVFWGGIGQGSLHLKPEEFLWTEINGRKIFYSLDTFFQANLKILPLLIKAIEELPLWDKKPLLLDLYGGVGFFTFALIDKFEKGWLIEECTQSLEAARFNAAFHKNNSIRILEGKVEKYLSHQSPDAIFNELLKENIVTIIDPPRSGLSPQAREFFTSARYLNNLLYLSCNPSALMTDLKKFVEHNWEIKKIIPFDFFPQTHHLETLVWLSYNG